MTTELISFEIWGRTLTIYFYGVFLLLAVIIGIIVLYKELSRRHLETKHILDNIFWILLLGVIGARIGYVIFHLDFYLRQPLAALMIWQGGLNFTGGLIFGLMAAIIWLHYKNRKEMWSWLDAGMIAFVLSHAVGMLGSFASGLDYGRETNMPWGVKVTALNDNILRHPTQIYEFIAYLISYIIFVLISGKIIKNKNAKLFPGFIFWLGFALTFFVRFMVEFWRVPDRVLFNMGKFDFSYVHIVSLIFLIIGLVGLIYKEKKFLKNK